MTSIRREDSSGFRARRRDASTFEWGPGARRGWLLGLALLLGCGSETGWKTVWNLDGTLIAEETGLYSAGRKVAEGDEGLDTYLHPNGRRAAMGRIQGGLQHGLWIYWYESGARGAEGEWVEGRRENRWTSWYEEGQMSSEGRYQDGERTGLWTYWRRDGRLDTARTGTYLDDRWVSD